MSYVLSVNNRKIYEFYEEHKNLNFESMNVLFVDLLDTLLRNTNPTLDGNIAASLIDSIKTLQGQVNNMEDTITKNQGELGNIFTLKFLDFKKDYMEDMRLILSTNATEKVGPIVKEYNDSLLDKTRIMVSEIIPKNQEILHKNIDASLQQLQNSINQDTTTLMNSTLTKDVLEKYSSSLDEKFSNTLLNSQNLMNSLITSTEKRLDSRLSELKDISSGNNSVQDNLCSNINELLRKMENSSAKGKISENILFNVLHPLYPTAQIESVGTTKETGDIIMKRRDKPTIIFENKNYNKNVSQDEVTKFLRDIETQNCCGIMLAQHFGIANKNNFEIEIHDNNVLVYLHEVNYNADKIKLAIDAIDYFKSCLDDLETGGGEQISLSREFLGDINKEYQNFANNKLTHIKTIKDYQQKLLSQVDDLKLPGLEHYLSRIFASSASKDTTCEFCNYVAKNTRALSAHYRGCSAKKQHDQDRKDKLTLNLQNTIQYNPNNI